MSGAAAIRAETAPAPPRPDAAGFRRELTPTWLSAACLLGGHRPPVLRRDLRCAYLGCGLGVTPAVVAAVHPDASVWAWDPRPGAVETSRLLRDDADLENLVVHERPGLPMALGGGLVDVVVVQDVLVTASDERRAEIVAAIGENLRPGGLVCVTYKTSVGWGEIAPVVTLMRYVAWRHPRGTDAAVGPVLDLLARLRAGGAKHLTERPVVGAWLDELAATDPATIHREYLADDLRPLSHAQIRAMLSPAGCEFVGSARVTDELGDDLPAPLTEMVRTAPTSVLREAYRDLATRPASRLDVFRRGAAPLQGAERDEALASMEVIGLGEPDAVMETGLDPAAWRRLCAGPVPASHVAGSDPAASRFRRLLGAGHVHPVVHGGIGPGAVARCRALNSALAERAGGRHATVAAALPGSAVPEHVAAAPGAAERLGTG